ncbi:SDR family oxidoreductase [Ramlibacter sp. WS9]|uniref:SDR family oxidoreductase n=1 Tax=Ramlibacter sp. WS9 TaxID=1882741 RepID=UPI001143FCB5|nr:SDR family oxidoreductase [Ramlibacter sp. WS9]ROZ69156.1 SDR family oxidoreductase [Ramlibacter sp. WS9]
MMTNDSPGATSRVIYVVGSGIDIGSPMAAALAGGGARVAWISDLDGAPATALPDGVVRVPARFDSRAAVTAAFAVAQEALGPPQQVVLSVMPEAGVQPQDIVATSDAQWRTACGQPMKTTLYVLQAAHGLFTAASGGGSVVVIGGSFSLAGAAQLIPFSTGIEGQRGLVKSTARQWGKSGITVNWVAAAAKGLSDRFADIKLPFKGDSVPVAFGRTLDLAREIVPVVEFLGGPAGRVMTGATLLLDGGEWMVP